jgi:hypothetical protein
MAPRLEPYLVNGLARMHSSTDDLCHRRERRKRSRACVQWTVSILGPGLPYPIQGMTVNLSACGFYGTFRETLKQGCQLKVRIVMLSPVEGPRHDVIPCLECWASVVRLEAMDHGLFGAAFSFDNYTVNRVVSSSPYFAKPNPLVDKA